jgi:hypothetical protein
MFKSLGIIHKAMMGAILVFGAIASYLKQQDALAVTEFDLQMQRLFQVIAIVLAAVGFMAGGVLFKKRLFAIREMPGTLREKMGAYTAACLLQWALLEGPALFCVVAYYLTGNYAFLGLGGVLVLLLFLHAPSRTKTAFQLGVTEQDLDAL